ncbi:MAG: hypothetical protein FD123_3398 [Bacteroidetes bacterium]|nr:MAG: hypothetical protein FD123_3398 [Bacteroidota bacterium]
MRSVILVPTDFTPVSDNVFPLAAEIARRQLQGLALLHSYDSHAAALLPSFRDNAVHHMRMILRDNELTHLSYRCYLRAGDAGKSIIQLTRQQPISLVVMGKRRTSQWSGTTYRVVCRSGCPVLVVPHHSHRDFFERILFVSENMRSEEAIARQVTDFAALFDSHVTFLEIRRKSVTLGNFHEESIALAELTGYARLNYFAMQAGSFCEGVENYLSTHQLPDLLAVSRSTNFWFLHPLRRDTIGRFLGLTHFPLLFFNNDDPQHDADLRRAHNALEYHVTNYEETFA